MVPIDSGYQFIFGYFWLLWRYQRYKVLLAVLSNKACHAEVLVRLLADRDILFDAMILVSDLETNMNVPSLLFIHLTGKDRIALIKATVGAVFQVVPMRARADASIGTA